MVVVRLVLVLHVGELGMRLDPAVDEQLDELRSGAAASGCSCGRGRSRGSRSPTALAAPLGAQVGDLGLDRPRPRR